MEFKDNMATTYEKIATTTLSTSATEIDFTSIAATWTDLRLVLSQIGTYQDLQIQINGDTGNNYSVTALRGNGSAASSSRQSNVAQYDPSVTAGTSGTSFPMLYTIDFFSYAGSTFKTILGVKSGDFNGSGSTVETVGLWRSASAITSLKLKLNNADNVGTTATLYGILKA